MFGGSLAGPPFFLIFEFTIHDGWLVGNAFTAFVKPIVHIGLPFRVVVPVDAEPRVGVHSPHVVRRGCSLLGNLNLLLQNWLVVANLTKFKR